MQRNSAAMRLACRALFLAGLLACAGCDANGAAQGGGSGNSGHGYVTVGVPF